MQPNNAGIVWPDYDKSILGIPNAILRHYGALALYPSPHALVEALAKGYRNIVLLVFDGMGSDMLRQNLPEDAFLRQYTVSDILSVYPCTTTAAITAYETGLPPIAHGWLGWSCYFKEIGQCVDLFTNQIAKDTPAAEYDMARTYMPYTTISETIGQTNPDLSVWRVSAFSQTHYAATAAEACAAVREICLCEEGRQFVNAYCNQPDLDMHMHGCYSEPVRQRIRHINSEVERLCNTLSDTLVIVSADHGLTNTKDVYIEEYPALYECLLMRPSIESRCLSLFVKDGMKDMFAERFNKQFENDFILLTKEDALAKGIFGQGTPHPKVQDFLGDFIAVATGNIRLTHRGSSGPFKAMHAGLRAEEMEVPLILIEKE